MFNHLRYQPFIAHKHRVNRGVIGALILVFIGLLGCAPPSDETGTNTESHQVVTVYSARKEHLIKPIFDRYTQETGIKVRYITDSAGPLLTRLKAEGEQTPADLFLTVDAGYLWHAGEAGVLQPFQTAEIKKNVPEYLRASDDLWVGLAQRARTLVYATDRVKKENLSRYEDLASPSWKGRLCLRTSKKVYNQSLVATMMKTLGAKETEAIVRGWVDNLATAPFSNDTKAMEAVAAGQCDVTVVNTYYYGRLMREKPELPLGIFWPNQGGRGVHVNISGAGITKHAKNRQGAENLLLWLSQPEAQAQFAELNQEYPVNPNVSPAKEVAAWGDFKADQVNVEASGRLQAEAIQLMDRAGYL